MEPELEYELLKQEVYSLRFLPLFSASFNDVVASADQLELTEPEKEARHQWNIQRGELVNKILELKNVLPADNSIDLFTDSAILPPPFATSRVERNLRVEPTVRRYYPFGLSDWSDDFLRLVNNFTPPNNLENSFTPPSTGAELDEDIEFANILLDSVNLGQDILEKDVDEQYFLKLFVWGKLKKYGLMTSKDQLVENGIRFLTHGLPDCFMFAKATAGTEGILKPSAIFEVKSSHDLLVPNEFDGIQEQYELGLLWVREFWHERSKARENKTGGNIWNKICDLIRWAVGCIFQSMMGFNKKDRISEEGRNYWSKVCDPIAQTVCYMIDNDCRYGALCSSSKTYFIHLDKDYNCKITNGWFTSDENYLKAWAAFANEAATQK